MSDKTRAMEDIVEKFLHQNPSFLQRNPALLKELELKHSSGPAVSLIERQVQYLRNQNASLEQRLGQLVQVATENEKLMSRLHRLTLELMTMNDLPAFFNGLAEALLSEFNSDIINITLFDNKVEAGPKTPIFHAGRDDLEIQQFQDLLDKKSSVCGRLNRNKRDYLFGNRGQWVQSTALVSLGNDGILAIGSSDPARFYPGMGTLFLDLLASVVTSRLALEVPEKKRRSA